ncbi:branched-chain amino acid transport system II carrier protein [Eupransor demetentiae]|uniref:Branched-chain amino acid transport system carrier protein n=1 Tax=Eupransor demetentiae TaxID=3109584 RepID=A0ABP0ENN1_9LACO|nr:Branched-chain amino acid permease (BrnQ) [Lactobacillaceae bacterium LMG 33000]
MQTKKLSKKQLFLLASLIFGMFFGAGNLIFPVQLGQLAGKNWLPATAGFLLTGTVVPFLAMLAVSITRSKSIYDLARPVTPWFAAIIVLAIHLTLGPLGATPRTAATAFAMGFAPLVPASSQNLVMLIFSAIFFILAYFFTVKESNLTKWIGKYLNPIFIVLLLVVFLLALLLPMGGLNQTVSSAYASHPTFTGVLDGYNTMDGLALLGFAVSVIYATQKLGFSEAQTPKVLAQAGTISILFEAFIYIALVLLGVSSLSKFAPAANGGVAFSQIITHYAGNFGIILTAIIVTLAVFTTAMGLGASFAQDLNRLFPKIPYHAWLLITFGSSFITANAGLTNIMKWSVPVLMLVYPYALTLIILALLNPWIQKSPLVYRTAMIFITPSAFLDALASTPFAGETHITFMAKFYHAWIPLAQEGLGWIIPAIIGLIIGFILMKLTQKSAQAA